MGITATVFVVLVVIFILVSEYLINVQLDRLKGVINNSGQVKVGLISGSLLKGLVLEDLKFLPESDDFVIPSWTGRRMTLKVHLMPLLSGKIVPRTVIFENFTFRFRQNPDGTFSLPVLPSFASNSQGGTLQIKNLGIVVKNSMIEYDENESFIRDPLEPLSFRIDDVNATGSYSSNGYFTVRDFEGKFIKSTLKFHGQVGTLFPYNIGMTLNIERLGLSQFADSLARLFPSENKMLPTGDGNVEAKFDGSLVNPLIAGKCHLNNASLGNTNLDDIYFNFDFANKKLTISDGVAKAYNGRVKLSGEVDASIIPPVFWIDTEIKDIDLGKYILELNRGIQPISGSFSGIFQGSGDFISQDSLRAEGSLACDGGMYLNPFKGAKGGLFSTRQEEKMGFDSLNLDFALNGPMLIFNNLEMKSKWMDLSAGGDIKFNGAVDVKGTITSSSELIASNPRFKEITPFLSSSKMRVPIRFALSGTPGDYTFHSALTEEAIDKLLGKDQARREAARRLLEQYFGSENSDITDSITNSIPDMN